MPALPSHLHSLLPSLAKPPQCCCCWWGGWSWSWSCFLPAPAPWLPLPSLHQMGQAPFGKELQTPLQAPFGKELDSCSCSLCCFSGQGFGPHLLPSCLGNCSHSSWPICVVDLFIVSIPFVPISHPFWQGIWSLYLSFLAVWGEESLLAGVPSPKIVLS